MVRKSSGSVQPASPARRHFMGIVTAGAGKLSAVAIASSVLVGAKVKDANALGLFPKDTPDTRPNCFARGTLILTAHGEVPVEDLANGTLVVTTNGAVPVKWIGRQTIRRNASASWHPSVLPIRVSRSAIDDQTPRRDLILSPEHALLVDGALIPVKYLVNGLSISVDDDAMKSETIEYFSIELDSHEIVFAEGMAAETFRYTGGRHRIAWDNLGEYQDLFGEHEVMPAFAPIYRYSGLGEVRGLLRLGASRFADVRDPVQIAYDRIAARAMTVAA
jgi:hypothetical protein